MTERRRPGLVAERPVPESEIFARRTAAVVDADVIVTRAIDVQADRLEALDCHWARPAPNRDDAA